jgi:hypothetical protein
VQTGHLLDLQPCGHESTDRLPLIHHLVIVVLDGDFKALFAANRLSLIANMLIELAADSASYVSARGNCDEDGNPDNASGPARSVPWPTKVIRC